MTDKEIIIDGIKYFKQCDINKGLDEEHYVTEFHLLATHYNLLLEDYALKYNNLKEQFKRKEQECKEYKDKVEYIHAFLRSPHNYGSFRPMWGSFLLHWLFNEDLGDFFPEEAYEMTDTIAEKEKQIIKYKQALDEIEKIANKQRKFDLTGRTPLAPVINEVGGDFIDILDIIEETKNN